MNNDTQLKILNFIDIENDKNISFFIDIVKSYYYNNDLPKEKGIIKMKEWFKLKNLNEIEEFLKSINDEQYDEMIEMVNLNNKEVGSVPYHKKCILPMFMGSLDKIKNENEYKNWIKKINNTPVVTEKLDGISALLSINILNNDINKKELTLCTRGNGKIGCDISHLLKYLNINKSINNTIKHFSNDEFPVHIRGELIMKKNKDDINLRNIVSGLVHTKEITEEVKTRLNIIDFVAYRLYNKNMNFMNQLNTLKQIGYNVPKYIILNDVSYDVIKKCLVSFTENSKYQIDGIVITDILLSNADPIDKNPEHSIAIKNTSAYKQTQVVEIDWNVSKHGVYKPRIKIQPININGVTIEWVTGFNAKYINDNNIGKGTLLEVERSGDVIPNIKNIIKSTKSEFPSGNWKWNKTCVDIVTEEENNDEMEIKKLLTFFQELECPHLGPKTIEILYNNEFKTVFDILNLTKQDLLNTGKFKDKSSENVLSGIQVAKDFLSNINNNNLHILMYASGSFGFGFGSKKIKLILDVYPNIIREYEDKNRDLWIENIKSVKGISEQAVYFVDNINKYKHFIKIINTYIKFTDTFKQKETKTKDINTKIKETIVLTGFRDKDLKKLLEEHGHIINDNVTKETTIVVYNEDESSSKCQKAKKMGIKLVQKNNILSMLNINN